MDFSRKEFGLSLLSLKPSTEKTKFKNRGKRMVAAKYFMLKETVAGCSEGVGVGLNNSEDHVGKTRGQNKEFSLVN